MLPLERQNQILEILEKRKAVSVEELCRLVYSSGATIRRDLALLEASGQIHRTHGGAVFVDSNAVESPLMLRESENRQAKSLIAQKAVDFLRDGQTLFLDSSSTANMLAGHLGQFKNMRVITNSLKTVNLLASMNEVEVYCTGGRLRESARSLVGSTAIRFVDSFHTDYSFISCRGVDLDVGVTESSEDEAAVKIASIRNASRTVLLCDSSKLDRKYFCKVCDLSQLWDIVSNEDLPPVFSAKTGFAAAKRSGK